jgi:UDP-N-acetylglucosamine enolpyruvyl transferase
MVIEGGYSLRGSVKISGAKNAGLVLIAASIMAVGETILDNVPRICDTEIMIEILNEIGCRLVGMLTAAFLYARQQVSLIIEPLMSYPRNFVPLIFFWVLCWPARDVRLFLCQAGVI